MLVKLTTKRFIYLLALWSEHIQFDYAKDHFWIDQVYCLINIIYNLSCSSRVALKGNLDYCKAEPAKFGLFTFNEELHLFTF